MTAAVQLWGPSGIPIAVALFGALSLLAVKVGARTEHLYQAKTEKEGVPVFAALLGGTAGGDLLVTRDGLQFVGGRQRVPSFTWAASELRSVRVARKGPLGSAALMTIETVTGDRIWLEVADGPRLAGALEDVIDLVVEVAWGD
ncbi:MAG TPA: hypothetical protein VM784_05760 [Actinomycetota bacterium]|nr:hypothetical protein [Actinomycetota bacterium]